MSGSVTSSTTADRFPGAPSFTFASRCCRLAPLGRSGHGGQAMDSLRGSRRAVAALTIGLAALAAPPAHAATTRTFGFTGAEQSFKVPGGVRSIHVVATGARGGTSIPFTAAPNGGMAGLAIADLKVAPGQVIY